MADAANAVAYRERDAIARDLAAGHNPYGGYQNAVDSTYNTYGRNSGVSYQEWAGIIGEAYPRSGGGNTGGYAPSGGGGGYSGGGGGGGVDRAAQEAAINSTYQPLFDYYDSRLGSLGARQQASEGGVNEGYNIQKGSLDTSVQRANDKIGENKANALRDLENNIRAAFNAGQIKLGNAGAGDSSATGQYSFALTRLSNQNRGTIQRDANQQLADVETGRLENMAKLDLWKNTEMRRIAEQYQAIRDQLEEAKANTTSQRAGAIANLQLQLAQSAASALGGIQQRYDNALNGVSTNAFGGLDTSRITNAQNAGQGQNAQVNGGFNIGNPFGGIANTISRIHNAKDKWYSFL